MHVTPNRRRNEPCPCGSGLRYKACCGKVASAKAPALKEVATSKAELLDTLQIGDFVPFFELNDQDGNTRELQLYAGRPIMLFFVPAGNADVIEAIHQWKQAYDAHAIHALMLLPSHPGALKVLQKELSFPASLWADEHQQVSGIFGVDYKKPVCFVLDANVKIISAHAGEDLIDEVEGACKPLLEKSEAHIITKQAPVMIVPNVLSKSLCEEIISYWEKGEQYEGTVGIDKGRKVNTNMKRRTDSDIRDNGVLKKIDRALSQSLFPEMKKAGNVEVTHRELYKVGCYLGEEKGYYNQHRDTSDLTLANRRFSMSICLNEDYEGGGLVFPEYGADIYKAGVGDATVFPSTLMHRVEPVTKGKRFVLISFFYGDAEAKFRSEYRKKIGKKDDTELCRVLDSRRFDNVQTSPVFTQQGSGQSGVGSSLITPAEQFIIKEDVPPEVLVIENYLTPETCKKFARYADEQIGQKLKVVDNAKTTSKKVELKESEGRITEYVSIDGIADEVLGVFMDMYCKRLAPFFDVQFEWFERPQILRYLTGGKYNQHADSEHWDREKQEWIRGNDRDISVLVYLNEEFEGGELSLIEFDYKIKPTTGMLLAFPSDHRYLHAAEPTTAGTRYAMVSWAATMGTPRVQERPPYAATILRTKR